MNQQNKIFELVNTPNLSGADMTSSLKAIGNGNMQNGIRLFADWFHKSGVTYGNKVGFRNGLVTGSVVTLVLSSLVFTGLSIKNKHDKLKQEKLLKEKESDFAKAVLLQSKKWSNANEKDNWYSKFMQIRRI